MIKDRQPGPWCSRALGWPWKGHVHCHQIAGGVSGSRGCRVHSRSDDCWRYHLLRFRRCDRLIDHAVWDAPSCWADEFIDLWAANSRRYKEVSRHRALLNLLLNSSSRVVGFRQHRSGNFWGRARAVTDHKLHRQDSLPRSGAIAVQQLQQDARRRLSGAELLYADGCKLWLNEVQEWHVIEAGDRYLPWAANASLPQCLNCSKSKSIVGAQNRCEWLALG